MSSPEETSAFSQPDHPRVYLIAVQSLDGFMTEGDRPGTAFASPADQKWFSQALRQMDALVMGAGTYLASRNKIRSGLTPDRPRFVCTRDPQKFAAEEVADALIFTRANPADLIASIAHSGRRKVALLGGGETNARFLHSGCVDELWITVEPFLFGSGVPLAPDCPTVPLQLISTESLGAESLLLKYRVGRED